MAIMEGDAKKILGFVECLSCKQTFSIKDAKKGHGIVCPACVLKEETRKKQLKEEQLKQEEEAANAKS